jgi:hypothetical protein
MRTADGKKTQRSALQPPVNEGGGPYSSFGNDLIAMAMAADANL